MTTPKTNDIMRIILVVAQVVVVPIVSWVAISLTDIKARVAVIESDIGRLTSLHQSFHEHEKDKGIHQHPDVKKAVTYEIVDKKIDQAIDRIERKLEEFQRNVPPQWFLERVEAIARRVEALESEKGNG